MEKLKEKHQNIKKENKAELHQWQIDIIDERLYKIAEGNEKFQDFDTAIDEIEQGL